MSNINIRELVLTEDEELKNGFVKVLCSAEDLTVGDAVELIQKIFDTEDFSLLEFDENDFTNDINTIDRLKEVLITNDVCYRKYIDSDDDTDGIVFGNGNYLNNFRGYGFQLSGNMSGYLDLGSFYINTIDEILITKCNKEYKIELLKLYLKVSVGGDFVNLHEKEINSYLEWLIDSKHEFKDLVPEKLEYTKVELGRMRLIKNGKLGLEDNSGWFIDKENERFYFYKNFKDIQIINNCLSIDNKKLLSEGATGLFLSVRSMYKQLMGFVSYIFKDEFSSAKLVK